MFFLEDGYDGGCQWLNLYEGLCLCSAVFLVVKVMKFGRMLELTMALRVSFSFPF